MTKYRNGTRVIVPWGLDEIEGTVVDRPATRSSPCASSSMTVTSLRSRPILDSGHPTSEPRTQHRAERAWATRWGRSSGTSTLSSESSVPQIP